MTQTRFEPRDLLTVMEAAKQLHVSDDTVRRQIREGDLEAVQIGTTPTGRPRYRIPAQVVAQRLNTPAQATSAPALDRLRAAFAELSAEEQDSLIAEALAWSRARTHHHTLHASRLPAMSPAELAQRVTPQGQTLLDQQD